MADNSQKYGLKYQLRFVDELGYGKDGGVLKTDQGHAVKFLYDTSVTVTTSSQSK